MSALGLDTSVYRVIWLEAGLSTFRSKQSQGFFVTIKSVKISYISNL